MAPASYNVIITNYEADGRCFPTTLGAALAAAAVFGEPSALLRRGLALGRGAVVVSIIKSSSELAAGTRFSQCEGSIVIFRGFGFGSGRRLRQAAPALLGVASCRGSSSSTRSCRGGSARTQTTTALALALTRARLVRGQSTDSLKGIISIYAPIILEFITVVFVTIAFDVIAIDYEADACFCTTLGAAFAAAFGFGEPPFITFDLRDMRHECTHNRSDIQ